MHHGHWVEKIYKYQFSSERLSTRISGCMCGCLGYEYSILPLLIYFRQLRNSTCGRANGLYSILIVLTGAHFPGRTANSPYFWLHYVREFWKMFASLLGNMCQLQVVNIPHPKAMFVAPLKN
jgi:hypothetical protein